MQRLPPREGHWPSRRPRLPVVLALLLVGNLLAALGFAAARLTDGEPGAVLADPHRRPAPTAVGEASADPRDRDRREAVAALLARRAAAVRAGDREAFLATVDPRAQRLRDRQARLFDNLTALPLAVWEYHVAPDGGSLPVPSRLQRHGGAAWVPRLVLRYRFDGFDAGVVQRTTYLAFVRHPTRGWLVGGSAGRDGYRGDREIWQVGRLEVVEGKRALVVGLGTPRGELRRIAAEVRRAVPVVSGVWGGDWSRHAVVIVSRTHREASVISADDQDLSQIAALATVASGPGGVPPPGTGDRIVVDHQNFRKLSRPGRQIVLTHELAHVATRGATTSRMPLWLVEGFADYVGYRSVDTPVRGAARDLVAEIAADRLPERLPSHRDFDAGADDLSQTYAEAWLACRFIAERYGDDRLVDLYRVMGTLEGTEEEVEAAALASVLDTDRDRFVEQWRSYLRKRLG